MIKLNMLCSKKAYQKMKNQDPVRTKDSMRTQKQGPEDQGPRILEKGSGTQDCVSSEEFLTSFCWL